LAVRSITNQVSAGATTPDKFPTKFCMPVQRPAAGGPAKVCVIAQIFEEQMPKPMVAQIRAETQRDAGAITVATRKMAAIPMPPAVNVLRTSVGLAPAS